MLRPEIFVPKTTLELPTGEPPDVHLALTQEAQLLIMPLGAAALLGLHMQCLPDWREWPDGRGGSMHIVDRNGEDIPLAALSGAVSDRALLTPYNTDGYTIHDDEKTIIAYGASFPDHLFVLWGVSTQPLSELLETPEEVNLQLIHSQNPRDIARAKLNGASA